MASKIEENDNSLIIFDLASEIKSINKESKKEVVENKKRVDSLKKSLEKDKEKNKEVRKNASIEKKQIKSLESKIKTRKNKLNSIESLEAKSLLENEIESFKKEKNKLKNRLADYENKILTTEMKKNTIDRLSGKDYYYSVEDKFNKNYKVKISEIREMGYSKFSESILEKYIEAMEEALEKDFYKSGKPVKEKTKDKIRFLIENAKANLRVLKNGGGLEDFSNGTTENYPTKVEISGHNIIVNF